jgi:hypothetical protein
VFLMALVARRLGIGSAGLMKGHFASIRVYR